MVGTVKKSTETRVLEVIVEEGVPGLRRRLARAEHVLGYAGLADLDSQFQQFTMDVGSALEAVNDSFWASSANRTETNFPFDGKVSFFFAKNIIAHFCLVRKRLNWVEVESIERFRSTCECRSSLLRFAS